MKLEKVIKSKFSNEWGKVVVNTIYTGNLLTEMTMDTLKPYNLNDQHFNILRILRGKHPECASPGHIKEVLLNKRGDLTRLTDKLVKMGYVERYINPENRRMVNLKITQAGLDVVKLLSSKMTHIDFIKDNLTQAEAKQLNELLDKLRG
ncbi:MAG: MarR family winged helix-turn-helix transcriptional regulator [Flammeovirgaceae bacterium]